MDTYQSGSRAILRSSHPEVNLLQAQVPHKPWYTREVFFECIRGWGKDREGLQVLLGILGCEIMIRSLLALQTLQEVPELHFDALAVCA